jgi:nucleotide-binding universal stress UspA family protein
MLFAVAYDVGAIPEHCRNVLETARRAAAGSKGARLLLVTVVRESEGEEAQRVAQAALAAQPGCEGVVLHGDEPGRTLVEFVDAFAPHVLVVGSSQKGALESLVLGSTSQFCLQHAKCSVMVARSRGVDNGGAE